MAGERTSLYWISFGNEREHLGVVILNAAGPTEAVLLCNGLGLNPGTQDDDETAVFALTERDSALVRPDQLGRLLKEPESTVLVATLPRAVERYQP